MGLLAIEVARIEVVKDGRRDEVLNGVPGFDTAADIGSGDLHEGGLEEPDLGVLAQFTGFVLGALVDVHRVILQNGFVVFPLGQGRQIKFCKVT